MSLFTLFVSSFFLSGLQVNETESLEMNEELVSEDSPFNMAPSQCTCDVTSRDLHLLLPNEAELQNHQQENQQKILQPKLPPKEKQTQKISTVDFCKMQMLTTEHQFRMKLMAEEYQRRMEMTRLEHELRMKNMADENSACLKRHALEIEMIRTKKEILNKRLMCLSNNLIFDYTKFGE